MPKFWLAVILLILNVTFVQGQSTQKDTIKIDSLKSVIVTAALRPKINGDTIAYKTSGMQFHENSNVAMLLRRIPGIVIQQDGTITYNGQKIQHLFIDGQDLLAGQSNIILNNFQAKDIAQVQMIDRVPDQIRFSGVDDGNREKTINLVLKEEARHSYFGKVSAGIGGDGFHQESGLITQIEGNKQAMVLGYRSNTGTDQLIGEIGGIGLTASDIADPLQASAGQGIPTTTNFGGNYANAWAENHIRGTYQFTHVFTEPKTESSILQILPDSLYTQQQKASSINTTDQHTGYGYGNMGVKGNELLVIFSGLQASGKNQYGSTQTSAFNGVDVNDSKRTILSSDNKENFLSEVGWKMINPNNKDKFISFSLGIGNTITNSNGYLYAIDNFYQPNGSLLNVDTTNQYKIIDTRNTSITPSLSVSYPLWKVIRFYAGYKANIVSAINRNDTYVTTGGKYTSLVDSLSTEFTDKNINQAIFVNLEGHVFKDFTYAIGGSANDFRFNEKDHITDTTIRYSYKNFSPIIILKYGIKHVLSTRITFTQQIQEPSIQQLSPSKNNINPLQIVIGNPNLRSANMNRTDYNLIFVGKYVLNLNGSLVITNNSLVTKTTTDSLGRQIVQTVNASGNSTINNSLTVTRTFGNLMVSPHFNLIQSNSPNFIGSKLNNSRSFSGVEGVNIGYRNNFFEGSAQAEFTYTKQLNSLNSQSTIQYWQHSYKLFGSIYPVKHYTIGLDLIDTWQGKVSALGNDISVIMLNWSIERSINKFIINLGMLNTFNANAGLTRSTNQNIITQSNTNVLGRLIMLSLIYNFNGSTRKSK